jgi:hypothetical protein
VLKIAELLHWGIVNVGELGMPRSLRDCVIGFWRLPITLTADTASSLYATNQCGQANTLKMKWDSQKDCSLSKIAFYRFITAIHIVNIAVPKNEENDGQYIEDKAENEAAFDDADCHQQLPMIFSLQSEEGKSLKNEEKIKLQT